MRKQQPSFVSAIFFSKIALLIEGAVFVILAIAFGKSIMTKQSIQSEINKAREEIASLNQQEQTLSYQKLISSSSSFSEIQAKQKLNLQRPGEQVVVFQTVKTPQETQPNQTSSSHLKQWILYFFGK